MVITMRDRTSRRGRTTRTVLATVGGVAAGLALIGVGSSGTSSAAGAAQSLTAASCPSGNFSTMRTTLSADGAGSSIDEAANRYLAFRRISGIPVGSPRTSIAVQADLRALRYQDATKRHQVEILMIRRPGGGWSISQVKECQ